MCLLQFDLSENNFPQMSQENLPLSITFTYCFMSLLGRGSAGGEGGGGGVGSGGGGGDGILEKVFWSLITGEGGGELSGQGV